METLWKTQRRSAACGLLSGVFLVAAVVLSRRISGDAESFTSELAACLTGVAASLIAILAASVPDLVSARMPRPQRSLLISACGIPGVMLGLAILPAGSTTGMACLLGLYVAAVLTVTAFESELSATSGLPGSALNHPEDAAGLARSVTQNQEHQPESSFESDHEAKDSEELPDGLATVDLTLEERLILQASKNESDSEDNEPVEDHADDSAVTALSFESSESMPHPSTNPDTTQWMSRSCAEGIDVAEGSFRIRFAAGQRLAPVHLPFSPPLADTPEFECEPADNSDLRFRTTAVHAYGVRIEVSRSEGCDEEAVVEVAWMASAAVKESLAA